MGGYSRLLEEELLGVPAAAAAASPMSTMLPDDMLTGKIGRSGSAVGLVMVKMSLNPAFSEVSLTVFVRVAAVAAGAGTAGLVGAAEGGGGFLGA